MTCLLCDSDLKENAMHRIAFRIVNPDALTEAYPEIDLRAEFQRYGVCDECFTRYQGQRHTLVFKLNELLHWLVPKPTVH